MQDKVRIGFIGYGKAANLHAEAMTAVSRGTLVAVCGRNPERRGEFAARWNIASRETVDEMVRLDKADAVIISTPHPLHCEGALEALGAGAHVLVEKPMALSEAECNKMIAASEKAGKLLSVMSQRRWFPACRRIRNAIDEGKLGKPILAQVTILGWRDKAYYESDPWRGKWETEGGGILINQAPHQIDLMLWYMGPFAEVHGFRDNFNHPYIEV
ncbi:MAG: Gfo/Idh/MocA family oxidoreductase, partial [Treponema sp.]|nr:Gfo/Idh/MocA family oxidoreductase [Treponema sp.]